MPDFKTLKAVERSAAFHVLSQKSAAKRAASELKLPYGKVDAVVLTGNLTRAKTVMDEIGQRTSSIAPLPVSPGEDELEVPDAGGAAVLRQKEIVKE